MVGIYKITNPSNKIYIGQSINIEKRWEDYKKMNHVKGQPKLYRSLLKYGWVNHKCEIIEECTEDKLLERETHWKLYYKVLEVPSLCCKIDGKGGKFSKEICEKISKNKKGISSGNKSRNKGRIITEEENEKRSLKLTGLKRTFQTKQNMSLSRIKNKSKAKSIIQKDLNNNVITTFLSTTDAVKETKIKGIGNVLTGLAKTAGGYIWEYKNK